jgi:uncharacterized protein YjbI with pentapeptide repeats
MADAAHVERMERTVAASSFGEWSSWRWSKVAPDGIFGDHPAMWVDLSGVDFRKVANVGRLEFTRANLRRSRFDGCFLLQAVFRRSNLRETWFEKADLRRALFTGADMRGAHLTNAILDGADLAYADLRGADLRGAWLNRVTMVDTKLQGADLTGCRVYGAAVWDAVTDARTQQNDLVISSPYSDAPQITVDSLDVAQFIYLLLENKRLRRVIDTISSKIVLILGRFSQPHKAVIDAVRDELRKRNLMPVIFDFEKPRSKSLTGTITTLASMARFVVVDMTQAKSAQQELTEITHALPSLPIQPILRSGAKVWTMSHDLAERGVVLPELRYGGLAEVRSTLVPKVLARVQGYVDESAESPKGKVALVQQNKRLERSNEAKNQEIARLRQQLALRG